MFTSLLAIIFLPRLVKKAHSYAPSFIESHYGQSTKILLRELETVNKKIVKRETDVEYLKKCVTYQLEPKFPRFKLYKKEKQKCRKVITAKKIFLLMEIREHQTVLKS